MPQKRIVSSLENANIKKNKKTLTLISVASYNQAGLNG
jgi:hypothetical protein